MFNNKETLQEVRKTNSLLEKIMGKLDSLLLISRKKIVLKKDKKNE